MGMTSEKSTAVLVAAVLAGLAGFSVWRGHGIRAGLLFASALALLAAALRSPAFAGRLHRGWMRVVHAIGAANTVVLLALVYLIGFVGYRCWGRLTGRDSLARRALPQSSYWIRRTRTHSSPSQLERLY